MLIFYRELPLEEGFAIADRPKHGRVVAGREVSLASGFSLFSAMRGEPIRCWNCGCTADRWVVSKGANDQVMKPVLNLFATRRVKRRRGGSYQRLVMMTRDHIIPKCLGGMDAVANLRPGCEDCNGQRGARMTKADREFMAAHPELIDPVRAMKGAERAARAAGHDIAVALRRRLDQRTL